MYIKCNISSTVLKGKFIGEEELREGRFHNYYLKHGYGDLKGEALQRKILEDIENTLRYGEITPMPERESVVYRWNEIEVVVSTKEKNCGSIITAHPGD